MYPIFLKTVFSAEIPNNRDRTVCITCVPNAESITLMTIIEEKMDKTEEGQNAQLFIKLFALSGLESDYNLYKLQSY